jgi:hypothetical protein
MLHLDLCMGSLVKRGKSTKMGLKLIHDITQKLADLLKSKTKAKEKTVLDE